MAKLSISKAWDETREVLRRDGKLVAAVALALIVLPGTVQAVVSPPAIPGEVPAPGAWLLVAFIAIIVGVVGQLAVIRLALGPPTSVGEAIGHGLRRMPIYMAAMLLWLLPLILAMLLLAGQVRGPDPSAAASLTFLVLIGLVFYGAVRMIVASAVASAEDVGPIRILQRSWTLTRGSWWRLFGFILLFFIAVLLLMIAVGAVIGILVGIIFGTPEPMSVGALIVALVTQLAVAALTVVFLVMVARIYIQLTGAGEATVSVPNSGT